MTHTLATSLARLTAPRMFGDDGLTRAADGSVGYRDLPVNLVRMLRGAVSANGHREAVAEVGGPRLTYDELWRGARRVAGGLRAAGIGRGDRVAIRLGNSADWVLAFFGALLGGAIPVPVNVRLTDVEADYIVADSGAWCVARA